MEFRIIGDVHGKWTRYEDLLYRGFHYGDRFNTIQVGDMGVGFHPPQRQDELSDTHCDGNHFFIRGNHDHPIKVHDVTGYVFDGTVMGDVMFVGGADSIDKAQRTEGVDWWHDEECSMQHLYEILDTYMAVKPKVMITHDCPYFLYALMFEHTQKIKSKTNSAFEAMFNSDHRPDAWYFGHHHRTRTFQYGHTTFQCIGELDYVDVDLPMEV